MIQFCMFLSQVLSFHLFPKIFFFRFNTLNVDHIWWRVCHPMVRFFSAGVSISMETKIFPRDFCSKKQQTFSELGFQQTQRTNAVFCTDIESTIENFGARRIQTRMNRGDIWGYPCSKHLVTALGEMTWCILVMAAHLFKYMELHSTGL